MPALYLRLALLILISALCKSIAEMTQMTPSVRKQSDGYCDQGCLQEINAANDYINSLNQDQTANYERLLNRLVPLENEFYEAVARINQLIVQVSDLEYFLPGNVTILNRRIDDEISSALGVANAEIETLQNNVYFRLNNLTSEVNYLKYNQNSGNNNGNSGTAMDVYYNLTRRIDGLEYGRINNLTIDNNIWRKNFRIVNATFEKIKQNTVNCFCK